MFQASNTAWCFVKSESDLHFQKPWSLIVKLQQWHMGTSNCGSLELHVSRYTTRILMFSSNNRKPWLKERLLNNISQVRIHHLFKGMIPSLISYELKNNNGGQHQKFCPKSTEEDHMLDVFVLCCVQNNLLVGERKGL